MAATPKDVVKKLCDTLFEAGTDEKVKALMANYLIVGPLSFEATNNVFQRDTRIMLEVMREIGYRKAMVIHGLAQGEAQTVGSVHGLIGNDQLQRVGDVAEGAGEAGQALPVFVVRWERSDCLFQLCHQRS